MVELATGDEPAEPDAARQVGRTTEIALPVHQPHQRLEQHHQLHGRLQHRLLQGLHQRAPDHRLQRVGVGGVEQRDPRDAAVDVGVLEQQGLDGHAADAVADQDGTIAPGGLDHRFEIPRELLEVDGAAVRRPGLAQPRQVPEHEAEPIGEVALRLVPEGAVHAPAVGEDDRRRPGGPVDLEVEGRPRGAGDHLPLAVRSARRPIVRPGEKKQQDAAAEERPGRQPDPGPEPPGLPDKVQHARPVTDQMALMPGPEQVGRRGEDHERQKGGEEPDDGKEGHGATSNRKPEKLPQARVVASAPPVRWQAGLPTLS